MGRRRHPVAAGVGGSGESRGGHEDVAGVTVVLSTGAAEEAGLIPNTPRYNAAIEALLAVESRGRGRIRRALMGSVSDSVVRNAHCPVLIVRK